VIIGSSFNLQQRNFTARGTYCWNKRSCIGLHINHHASWFGFVKCPFKFPDYPHFKEFFDKFKKFTSSLVLFIIIGYNQQKKKLQTGVQLSWNTS
jgi:hypothetical protein